MTGFLIASIIFIQQFTVCQGDLPCREDFFLTLEKREITPKTRPAPPRPQPVVRFRPEDFTVVVPSVASSDGVEQVSRVVYFDFDSAVLRESEKAKIEDLRGKPGNLTITGYTCDLGPKEYNDRLALERAKSVQRYLGVDADVRGKGKCCYVSTDRRKNRRVEITGTISASQNPSRAGVFPAGMVPGSGHSP